MPNRSGVRKFRHSLYLKQEGKCHWCGRQCREPKENKKVDGPLPEDAFTVDHVVPQSRGGQDTRANKVGACYACNWKRNSVELKLRSGKKLTPELRGEHLKPVPADGVVAKRSLWQK